MDQRGGRFARQGRDGDGPPSTALHAALAHPARVRGSPGCGVQKGLLKEAICVGGTGGVPGGGGHRDEGIHREKSMEHMGTVNKCPGEDLPLRGVT